MNQASTINFQAAKVNDRLGCKIYDENNVYDLLIIRYTKKEIKELCIDDLIKNNRPTSRLIQLTNEILEAK